MDSLRGPSPPDLRKTSLKVYVVKLSEALTLQKIGQGNKQNKQVRVFAKPKLANPLNDHVHTINRVDSVKSVCKFDGYPIEIWQGTKLNCIKTHIKNYWKLSFPILQPL